MYRLIRTQLATAPDGLTVQELGAGVATGNLSLLDAALRDLHWRGQIRRVRATNGDVRYILRGVA